MRAALRRLAGAIQSSLLQRAAAGRVPPPIAAIGRRRDQHAICTTRIEPMQRGIQQARVIVGSLCSSNRQRDVGTAILQQAQRREHGEPFVAWLRQLRREFVGGITDSGVCGE